MPQPTVTRPRPPCRRTPAIVAILAITLLLLSAGCGSGGQAGDEAGGPDGGTDSTHPTDGEASSGPVQPGGGSAGVQPDGGGAGADLDRLTYADDRRPLDPDNIADVPQPVLAGPAERLGGFTVEQSEAIEQAAASPGIAILDVAGLLDDGPSAEEIESFGDGLTRNSSGELVVLDEPAALACADVEIALTDIDAGRLRTARDHVVSAAERSGRSELAAVRLWSATLSAGAKTDGRTGIDVTALVGFLSVCLDGGYVL